MLSETYIEIILDNVVDDNVRRALYTDLFDAMFTKEIKNLSHLYGDDSVLDEFLDLYKEDETAEDTDEWSENSDF